MGLLSFFKRHVDSAAPAAQAAAAPDAVAAARTRARRRLIGATVLLGVGVIGFPLLFETQPRPIPVDIPIEIPRKDLAPPLALPPLARPAAAVALGDVPEPPAEPAASRAAAPAEVVERAADQGRELPPPGLPTPVLVAKPPAAAASLGRPAAGALGAASASPPEVPKPAVMTPHPPAAAAAKPPMARASVAKPTNDALRAQALLDGQPVGGVAAQRVVVQVGAYSDAAKLHAARQKLEQLGLKTYTQVVESEGGQRTRVRVGPFASRAEADKTAARIKAAGLPVAILTL